MAKEEKVIIEKRISNSIMDILIQQLDIYERRIEILRNNKPYWFQREKLIKYNDKIIYLENKIVKIYSLIEKEIDFDIEISTRINQNNSI